MEQILFICTGNTCRSPMAEAYFNNFIKKANMGNKYYGKSAGLSAYSGDMVTENTIKTMKSVGINMENHRSVKLMPFMLDEADFIFTMTKSHQGVLTEAYPEYKNKIFSMEKDIEDPYGGNVSVYNNVRNQIEGYVKNIVSKLKSQEKNVGY